MVHFVGAGPGAPDLITVRGQAYLQEADVIIYAGSLVNPQLLEKAKESWLADLDGETYPNALPADAKPEIW